MTGAAAAAMLCGVERTARIRRSVHYSGTVQGVGFRATVVSLAARWPVSGYVRNLPDGRVELVAEGAAAELDRLCGQIAAHFGGLIADATSVDSSATGEFSRFEIRR